MRLGRAVSTWRKCCLFVCENFRTHNFRFRNSLYFFVLETPEKMPPLNTFGQNSLKSVVHATPEMQDLSSEGLFDFNQKEASLSKAWHTANSVWTAFGANSWDENWSSEEKLPMHSDPQMKMDCGHSNKMGMELSVDEIGRWIFINPHKARVFPLL